jgi:hypothetical protein
MNHTNTIARRITIPKNNFLDEEEHWFLEESINFGFITGLISKENFAYKIGKDIDFVNKMKLKIYGKLIQEYIKRKLNPE